jgi:hypothetical protein
MSNYVNGNTSCLSSFFLISNFNASHHHTDPSASNDGILKANVECNLIKLIARLEEIK